MRLNHSRCALPGGTAKRKAYCVAVSAGSIVQATCAGDTVQNEYFPVTEHVALSRRGRISHTYPLYQSDTGTFDHQVPDSIKIGTFDFELAVTRAGRARGHARYDAGGCDSGQVAISAARG